MEQVGKDDVIQMTEVSAIALGAVWIVSAGSKLKKFNSFADDLQWIIRSTRHLSCIAATVVFVELALAALLAINMRVAALVSITFLLILTATFILRAVSSSTLDCACFGYRRESTRNDASPLAVIRDSLRLVIIFVRNSTCAALAAIAAGISSWIPVITAAIWAMLTVASIVAILGLRRQIIQRPHPNLAQLKRRRRELFATYWHNGLWTSWIVCYKGTGFQ